VGSFNGKLRDELLTIGIFTKLPEVKVIDADYSCDCNEIRPPLALGMIDIT
jgi:hypothetical protein